MTTAQMEEALRSIRFFVGGLTAEQIKYYYEQKFGKDNGKKA